MSTPAHTVATNASFQALANCYLREVNPGNWHASPKWQLSSGVILSHNETHVVQIELELQQKTLAIGVTFRSLVGRHTLTEVYERCNVASTWQRVDLLTAQLWLVDNVYARSLESPQRLELIGRVIESHQVMTAYLEHWQAKPEARSCDNRGDGGFLSSEQSVVLGHWLHPTPKSRQGIHSWQHEHYAPETGGRFQLHFFAAARKHVEQGSLLDISAEEICRRIARQDREVDRYQRLTASLQDDYCLLPLHPLQAQWLLHQTSVRELLASKDLVDLGRLGPEFTATSSVRTLYCETLEFMVKLSIPVKITNSLRINLRTELDDSLWISKLLRECRIAHKFPALRPIEDPAYITLALLGVEESGFEVIFRSNPFTHSCASDCEEAQSIAALVQDALPGQARSQLSAFVHAVAMKEELSLEEASRRWFDAYWHCALEPTISIYDEFGISLEAHQQNTLLGFSAIGYPRTCYYRDIQGLALTEGARAQLLRLVPELAQLPKVFEADEIVRNGFGYYVFFNQLYSVINRLALDGLLGELTLLRIVRQKLIDMRPNMRNFGGEFIDTMLKRPTIPCKANLMTRIADMDELQSENELAVYTMIDNPIHALQNLPERGVMFNSLTSR